MLAFPVELHPDDNDTIFVTCPFLPEVKTFGESRDDAMRHAVDAIEEAIAGRMARWEDIDILPNTDTFKLAVADERVVKLPLQAVMKLLLFLACKQEGISRAELARRLDWHREQVDRLFRLDHASRIDQIDAAITAVGRTFDLELLAA